MKKSSKKALGALGAGMAAGAAVSMLGSYMMNNKASVRKTAKKAGKFISNMIDSIEDFM